MSINKLNSYKPLTIPLLAMLFLFNLISVCCDEKVIGLNELIKIAKTFQINIIKDSKVLQIKTNYGMIDFKNADKNSLETYAMMFASEFNLYTPNMIKKINLKRVVLCVALSFDGQLRGGVPDFEHDTLYLDVASGADDRLYQREGLHHEIFHIIDWRDDGELYKDDFWSALNPKPFVYGTGGKNAQNNPEEGVLTDKYPGFLNHYSTTGVEEDKAEVFAKMMVEADYLNKIIGKDKILNAKVERMKALTLNFSTDMNKKFWENAKKLVRPK